MTLTTHALVGAAAASIFPNHPYAAFTAGFLSHLAIDTFPHWDYTQWLRSFERNNPIDTLDSDFRWGKDFWRDLAIIAADAILGTLLSVWILGGLWGLSVPIALIGAWAGIFPDFLQFVYYKFRNVWIGAMLLPLQEFHHRIQVGVHRYHWGFIKGAGAQLVLVLLTLWAAYLAHF